MKEITLNGRTYLSTKRAAEITGYTTDYVGQLARKGSVAAEQVGRNWYVAEDAIKKHKFGEYAGAVMEEKEADAPALEILVEGAEEVASTPAEQKEEQVSSELEVTEVTEEETPATQEFEDPAVTVAAMQEAWDEWYKNQRTVSSDQEEVFLKREDVTTKAVEEEEQEVPITVSEMPIEEPAVTEMPEQEEERVQAVPSPVQQGAGMGLVMGALGLMLVLGLIVGGGYIVVRNDLAPLSSVIESTQDYITGTTTFTRDNQ